MRLVQAHIYGFGKWIDQSFAFESTEGLQSFYGENESGKSTLQQFILYMLFDLPPRMRQFYQPKTSSKFGGSLRIEDQGYGEFTIERTEGQCICHFPDGTRKDSEWFTTYLDGMTRANYEAIYAFSGEQLETIRQMKGQALSDVLFSVGLSGATTVYEAEKSLMKEMDYLFKPQGSKPAVNQQAAHVAQLTKDWAEQKEKEEEYVPLVNELDEWHTKLKRLEEEGKKAEESHLFYKQMHHLLPDYLHFREQEAVLEKYPRSISFPKQGIHRYENLLSAYQPLQTKKEAAEKTISQLDEKREDIGQQMAPITLYEQAKNTLAEKHRYEGMKDQLQQYSFDNDQLQRQIDEQMQMLDISMDHIEDYRYPLHLQQEWQELAHQLGENEKNKEKLMTEKTQLQQEKDEMEIEIEQLDLLFYPDEAREEMREAIHLFDEKKQEETVSKQRQAAINNFGDKRRKLAKNLLLSSSLIGLIFLVIAFATKQSYLGFLGFIVLLIGLGGFIFIRSTIAQMTEMMGPEKSFGPTISSSEYTRYKQILQEQEDLQQQATQYKIAKESIESKLMGNRKQMAQVDMVRDSIEKKIITYQEAYPILGDLQAVHWPGLFESILHVKELLAEKEYIEERKQQVKEQYDAFVSALQTFAPYIQETENISLLHLEKWLFTYEKYMEELQRSEQLLTEEKKELARLQDQIKDLEKQIERLFQFASVEDEEAYYQAAELYDIQQTAQADVEKFNQHIELTFSQRQRERIFSETWSSEEIAAKLADVEYVRDENTKERNQTQQRIAELEHAIEDLEMSDSLSKLGFRLELEKRKLQEMAEDWLVHKHAYEALQQAKQSYQEKYLQQIMARTEEYFALMTAGRFVDVFPPQGNELFIVKTVDGMSYEVTELSKGTIDQLYIALRLAIGLVMSERFDLPFLIDDAFIHFDEKRTGAMVELLEEISKKKQVILFTCHRSVANLTKAMDLARYSSILS